MSSNEPVVLGSNLTVIARRHGSARMLQKDTEGRVTMVVIGIIVKVRIFPVIITPVTMVVIVITVRGIVREPFERVTWWCRTVVHVDGGGQEGKGGRAIRSRNR